ncbi:hypothetical protein KR093_002696 [Drosophila rubida]|uniref:Myb/SANT-like DNA-binding domain-containing protein n=1 Tax=Drosophila rubida TaxID=30044 RepID=A0AAD4K4S0_9MUSC|nr:hypothetical protein KR093_002696 [Drosophila rubida]
MFLKLWQESVPCLLGVKTRVQVHKEIAEKMHIYEATHIEIKSKMDNMIKRYKKEMLRHYLKGEESAWEYFDPVHNILKETKYFNVWSTESFDFSPLKGDDSDSSDSVIWADDNKPSKKVKIETEETIKPATTPETASAKSDLSSPSYKMTSPERPASVKSDLSFSSEELDDDDSKFNPESYNRLALEEAKLAVQREELKLLKNMADKLSALHREFLKTYTSK